MTDEAPDFVDQLARLAALHQSGALSDAEFDAAKARVLGSAPSPQRPGGPPVPAPRSQPARATPRLPHGQLYVSVVLLVIVAIVVVMVISGNSATGGKLSGGPRVSVTSGPRVSVVEKPWVSFPPRPSSRLCVS